MIERGYDPDYIFGMDYISFRLLVDASERIHASDYIEQVNISSMGQADPKERSKALKPYLERAGLKGVSSDRAKGPQDFTRKFGRGV